MWAAYLELDECERVLVLVRLDLDVVGTIEIEDGVTGQLELVLGQ